MKLTLVKPNIGLPPEAFAELAYQGWLGGLDIAKDDELLGDVAWSPLSARAEKVGEARLRDARGVSMWSACSERLRAEKQHGELFSRWL